MKKAETILLESEERVVPRRGGARKVHAHLIVRSRLRRCEVELDIIDYYFLSVRMRRAGVLVREYTLDLRFVDPALVTSRRFAWRSMAATLLLLVALSARLWSVASSSVSWWQPEGLLACAALLGLAVCAGLVSVYRTTETLTLTSLHGRARVLECIGGLGTLAALRPFVAKLAAHTQLAAAARRSSPQEHLRDEMREHFRLKEAGALSDDEYEASKKRILAAHTPLPERARPAKSIAIASSAAWY